MELLNKKQLCDRFKFSRHYIDLYLAQGLPYIPGKNNGKRFNPESVEKYLAEIEVREAIIKRPSLEEEVNQLRRMFR